MAQTSIWRHGCTPWGIAAFILGMAVAPFVGARVNSQAARGARGLPSGNIVD